MSSEVEALEDDVCDVKRTTAALEQRVEDLEDALHAVSAALYALGETLHAEKNHAGGWNACTLEPCARTRAV